MKLNDYIAREVRGQGKRNGRLSSKFMVRLYEECDLGSAVFNDLPDPAEDDASIDEELLELLGQCHDENPVSRNPKPLVKYLTTVAPLNRTSFHGLLHGIVEGPLLSHSSAQKLQVAALGYIDMILKGAPRNP